MVDDQVARIQREWARERPDVDTAAFEVIGRVHSVGRLLTEQLVAVYSEFGLSEGEFDLLCALRRGGAPYERRPADLARATMVTTGGVTKRLDRLERRGIVERRPDPDDARGKVVRLTANGRGLIDAAYTAHMANETRLVDALTVAQRRQLAGILARWAGELEDTALSESLREEGGRS